MSNRFKPFYTTQASFNPEHLDRIQIALASVLDKLDSSVLSIDNSVTNITNGVLASVAADQVVFGLHSDGSLTGSEHAKYFDIASTTAVHGGRAAGMARQLSINGELYIHSGYDILTVNSLGGIVIHSGYRALPITHASVLRYDNEDHLQVANSGQFRNVITGSVTARGFTHGQFGQVPYATPDNGGQGAIVSGDDRFIFSDTNVRLGVKSSVWTTASPPGQRLHIADETSTTDKGALISYHQTGAGSALLRLEKSRGTFANPLVTVSGDFGGHISFTHRGVSAYLDNAMVISRVEENPSGTTATSSLYLAVSNASLSTPIGNQIIELRHNGSPQLGFFTKPPVIRQTITGSRGGNAALTSLLAALGTATGYGLIIDSTTLGSASTQTLAATYDAGSSASDQTMTVTDSKGGKIIIDSTGTLTGATSLKFSLNETAGSDLIHLDNQDNAGSSSVFGLKFDYSVRGTTAGYVLGSVRDSESDTFHLLLRAQDSIILQDSDGSTDLLTVSSALTTLASTITRVTGSQLQNATGSVGTPTYSFTSDTDTGMYNISSQYIGFTEGGLRHMYIGQSTIHFEKNIYYDAVLIAGGAGVYIDVSASTKAFRAATDNTDPTSGGGAATGRIPIDVDGATKYIPYY